MAVYSGTPVKHMKSVCGLNVGSIILTFKNRASYI